MAVFPSVKAQKLLQILTSAKVGYTVVRQKGSHRTLKAPNLPTITWSFHDGTSVAPGLVRKILCDQACLSEDEALALL